MKVPKALKNPIVWLWFVVIVGLCVGGYFLWKKYKETRDGYCLCPDKYGRRQSHCQARGYNRKHDLSVYTDLAKMQKAQGGPKWSNQDFGGMMADKYPPNKSCCV